MLSAESGALLSRPSGNFELAFDQAILWMARTSPYPSPLRSHVVHTSTAAHTYTLLRMGGKVLRARPPDHNGGATRPVGHGRAHDQRLHSEFCTPGVSLPSPRWVRSS